jgi:hypothetical protein
MSHVQELYMLNSMTPHERKHAQHPNRMDLKGGHRHNHIYNVCNRITFRGKKSRRVKPDDKKYFVSIFWENIALMPDVLNKILANKRKSNDRIHLYSFLQ